MKKPTHTRKGKMIIDLATGVVEEFKYVNEAKRRSTLLRKSGSVVRRLSRKLSERHAASSVLMNYVNRVGS